MKHLLPSMATAKVHMKHIRKNINSTKTQDTPPNEDKTTELLKTHSNHVFAKNIYPQQQIATNLTGGVPSHIQQGK